MTEISSEIPTLFGDGDFEAQPVDGKTLDEIAEVAEEVGGAYEPIPETEGAVGFTHFDTPSSEDNVVTILITKENMGNLPSQTLIRIKSLEDQRDYIGVISSGPFAEPDGLRTDSPIVVTTTVRGKIFLPRYHGRAYAQILGQEVNGQMVPPRYRPRPNSPVFPLGKDETMSALKVGGDARIGLAIGQEDIPVSIPTPSKAVLPRHTGILGTTGGGKSTTVSRLVYQLQNAGVATILIDVEGEYTEIDLKTSDPQMMVGLERLNLSPDGVKDLNIYHLVGRATSREATGGNLHEFSLRFSELSPYAVMEVLDMPEAQQERFIKAYDTTKLVMSDLKIFPCTEADKNALLELDELDAGYPKIKLPYLIDVAGAFMLKAAKDKADPSLKNPDMQRGFNQIKDRVAQVQTSHQLSWLGLIGRLGRLNRLKVFDNPACRPINYEDLIQPGKVSIIDLSDTDSPQVNNLVIADILRGVQKAQEEAIESRKDGMKPTPVAIIIEEAHEFLSGQRIKQMPVLFQQVAKIAKRGRKRWLGLVFVTQLPQHMPDEVLGLINNYVIHKISDVDVINRLSRSISGIDKSQWRTVTGLAPGQALVSLTSMTRPLLVAIDPTPCHLKLVE